jgi:DNA-binding SARP family transcriptional activator
VYFGLLGPLLVRDGNAVIPVSAPRQRVLLAALLLAARRAVAVDDLAEALWDGGSPKDARAAIHTAVQRLGATLGPTGRDLVRTRPPGYLIMADDAEFDVRRFGLLAAAGAATARAGRWEQAATGLREALSLWRGEPLADVPSESLRSREVPHLAEQRLHTLAARIEADLHLGRHSEVIAELRLIVGEHPLREGFHAQLMLALYRAGRQAEALAVYRDAQGNLAEELGLDPGPDLQRLHQRILRADRELLLSTVSRRGRARRAARPSRGSGKPRRASLIVESATAPTVPRQLPPTVRHFVGRASELKELSRLLDEAEVPGGMVVISAITGTAGIGKTALALWFAHQVAERFPDGQLYVNLRGFDPSYPPVSSAEAVRGFLDALGVPPPSTPVGLDAQAELYRSLVAGKRMLVVLDNAREAQQVRPLLPGTPACLVLVTSRNQLTSLIVHEDAQPLTLDLLPSSESHQLLAARVDADRVTAYRGAADDLVQFCAGLPLALSIVAARAASQPRLSLGTLSAELCDARIRLDMLDAGDPTVSVRAVFSWSYRLLSAPAARLFRMMGLHAGPDVSLHAAASLAGLLVAPARQALRELTRAHLLAEHAPGRYTFHDLLRAYAADQVRASESEADRQAAMGRMLDHYLHTAYGAALLLNPARESIALTRPRQGAAPDTVAGYQEALAWFRAEHRNLLAMAARAARDGFDTHAWQLPWTMVTFLDVQGQWADWAASQHIALGAARRLDDPHALARAHRELGAASIQLGTYRDAHAHLTRALGLFGKSGERVEQAGVHHAIAWAFQRQDRYREALGHARQAVALFQAEGHRIAQARALNGLGLCHAYLGDHQRAIACCESALGLQRELGDQVGEAAALDSLGYIRHQLGRHAEAARCYASALDLRRQTGARFQQAGTLERLGDTHNAAGDQCAARDTWRQALAILDELHHPDARGIRSKLDRLADPGMRQSFHGA